MHPREHGRVAARHRRSGSRRAGSARCRRARAAAARSANALTTPGASPEIHTIGRSRPAAASCAANCSRPSRCRYASAHVVVTHASASVGSAAIAARTSSTMSPVPDRRRAQLRLADRGARALEPAGVGPDAREQPARVVLVGEVDRDRSSPSRADDLGQRGRDRRDRRRAPRTRCAPARRRGPVAPAAP